MKHVLALASFLLLTACCSDALAADEFGARFGNSSPYALNNTLGNATNNVSGIGPEDLNIITPAAGAEIDPEAESDEAAVEEGMGAHAGPSVPPQAAPAHSEAPVDDISP